MKEQGQVYNDVTTAPKEEKRPAETNGTEPPDLAGLGPPHLRSWAAFARAAGSLKGVDQQAVAYLKDIRENEINKAASVQDLGQKTKIFRYKQNQAGKQGHRLQFLFADVQRMEFMGKLLSRYRWSHKVGPAPRSGLERQVQSLPDKVR